jgi:hypothetical protein
MIARAFAMTNETMTNEASMARTVAGAFVALAAVAAAPCAPALAGDAACKQAVANAFAKQRASKAFIMKSEMHGESGPVEITVEYMPPDKMHQTIVAQGQEPLETTLVGMRAWSRQGGAWEELMPAVAQTVIAQVRQAVVDPPQEVGEFQCLDKATIDGKQYLAYRSIERPEAVAKGPGGTPLHRTLYVDPQTGLPQLNIVAEEKEGAAPLFKGTYTYPAELEIEAHPEAPLVKMR